MRKYRALVHLGREARDRIVFGTADATLAKAAVDVVIREVKDWHSRRGKTSTGLPTESRAPVPTADEVFLPATQEALELTLNSGSGQVSILVSSDADEDILVAGVTAESNGSPLSKINRPKLGERWLIPAKGRLPIEWPPTSNVVGELVKLRGQYQGQFQAFIDFVFQCSVDDEHREFRRRMNVQVDALNKHAHQW